MSKSNKKKIWLSPPNLSGEERQFVQQAFDDNWIAPMGPNVDGFEEDIERFLESSVCVTALNSGTSAIHLALGMLGVRRGDEVICQSLTFGASAFPIGYLGASPIFVDSEYDTWNMDPELLEKALKECQLKGKLPKAIIAVHLYGMPYKSDEINSLAKHYGIPVIEDSAEALGSIYQNKKCGTLGHFGIFSFNGNKIITTSAGGALVCKSIDQKKEIIKRASQAREDCAHYEHNSLGYNYRLSNVLAGIGRGQMTVLSEYIKCKEAIFSQYYQALSDRVTFQEQPEGSESNRWLTCILTETVAKKKKLQQELIRHNIDARPLWKPLHLQPVFRNAVAHTNNVSADLFDRGLCLPSGTGQEPDITDSIIQVIKKAL